MLVEWLKKRNVFYALNDVFSFKTYLKFLHIAHDTSKYDSLPTEIQISVLIYYFGYP